MTPPFDGVAYIIPWGVWYTKGEINGGWDVDDDDFVVVDVTVDEGMLVDEVEDVVADWEDVQGGGVIDFDDEGG